MRDSQHDCIVPDCEEPGVVGHLTTIFTYFGEQDDVQEMPHQGWAWFCEPHGPHNGTDPLDA